MKIARTLVALLALSAGTVSAQNQQSDLMRITVPGAGPVVFAIPEVAAGAPETAIYNVPALGSNGLFAGAVPPGFGPPLHAVALLEPLGTPADPGEVPVAWPTATGQRVLSDLVISVPSPNLPGIVFISDGDANLAPWSVFLLGSGFPVTVLDETGAYQDVSALLLPVPVPYTVEVLSDVTSVPEPGIASLLLAGLGVVGWAVRRRSAR